MTTDGRTHRLTDGLSILVIAKERRAKDLEKDKSKYKERTKKERLKKEGYGKKEKKTDIDILYLTRKRF